MKGLCLIELFGICICILSCLSGHYCQKDIDRELCITVDNEMELFVDGVRNPISNDPKAKDWTVTKRVKLPAGSLVIAVKATDVGYWAGLLASATGDMFLSDRSWKVSTVAANGWTKPEFDDSKWEQATVIGPHTMTPWNTRGFISLKAKWIWGKTTYYADRNPHVVYFRYRIDINECAQKSRGNCEHECTNTLGSYYCSCKRGYFLRADKRTCQRKACGQPGAIQNGEVVATKKYDVGSYVKYTCRSPLITVGSTVRKCLARTYNVFNWTGSQPNCYDSCAWKTSRQCGPTGVTAVQCRQLGCCFAVSEGCFYAQDLSTLAYQGEESIIGVTIRATLSEETATGCSIQCRRNVNCQSFMIRRKPTDIVAHQDCFLLDQTRSQLLANNNLAVGNQAADLYEPIKPSNSLSAENINYLMFLVGCYDDFKPGFSYRVWSSATNSPEKCISTCRQQSFTVAALRGGTECYCDIDESLSYVNSSSRACTLPCPGDAGWPKSTCGNTRSSSVYRVPTDVRYIGCFAGQTSGMSLIWTKTSSVSASLCVDDCLRRGFKYAAMQNASRCYCTNAFAQMSIIHYDNCRLSCSLGPRDSCGGQTSSAVFSTGLGDALSSTYIGKQPVRHLYYNASSRLVEIPLRLFTEFPSLKSITSPRVILRATDSVITPSEDTACHANCYKPCGELTSKSTANNEFKGADQTVRIYHLHLANLGQYVGSDAQRVFVYAQTVVIDRDLQFPFSLQVYTRQLILDRTMARTIRVSGTAPTLSVNFQEPKTLGVKPNSMFQKQSLICARILLDTRQQNNINTGWAILYDLAHNHHTTSVETSAWANSVQSYINFLSGIDRKNIHFVPYYSKEYFSKLLALYFEGIKVYKNDYDKSLEKSLSAAQFAKLTEDIMTIYSATSVSHAKSSFDGCLLAVQRSALTYSRLEEDYAKAAKKVTLAGKSFEAGDKSKRSLILMLIQGFVGMISRIASRRKAAREREEAEALDRQLRNELNIQLTNFAENLQKTRETIDELNRFMSSAKIVTGELQKTSTSYDFSAIIETNSQLARNSVHWKVLKNNAHTVLSHPKVYNTPGCAEYMRVAMDMCDWGEALSNSAIEHSELLRDAIQTRYTFICKEKEAHRLKIYIDSLKKQQITRQQMTAALEEQHEDVRIDLNNVLFSFCQAYFYENLKECEQSYKPAFGGSLTELLLKINNALRGSLSVSATPSSISRRLLIKDRLPDNATCLQAMECPVKTFKETGMMHFRLPVDHSGFYDVSRYRVSEIELEFIGAKRNITTDNDILKVSIESSGVFYGKEEKNVYNFVTRPLLLAYEYEIETNYVTMRADVYPATRSLVQHITPFTTWIIRLSDKSRDIDLSAVTGVRMRFLGSASNNDVTSLQQQVMLAGVEEQQDDIPLYEYARDPLKEFGEQVSQRQEVDE